MQLLNFCCSDLNRWHLLHFCQYMEIYIHTHTYTNTNNAIILSCWYRLPVCTCISNAHHFFSNWNHKMFFFQFCWTSFHQFNFHDLVDWNCSEEVIFLYGQMWMHGDGAWDERDRVFLACRGKKKKYIYIYIYLFIYFLVPFDKAARAWGHQQKSHLGYRAQRYAVWLVDTSRSCIVKKRSSA